MSMRPGSYVEWQLAQAGAPRSVLAELVRRAVGTGIARIEPSGHLIRTLVTDLGDPDS